MSLLAAAAVGLAAFATASASGFWSGADARLGYQIYKPTATLGYQISSSGFQPCPGGKSKASLYATYGTYKGVLTKNVRGFDVFEGSPAICSDPGEFTQHRTRTIGGARATLGVYCDPSKRCSLAQGVQNGYILLWKRGATRIQMDSAHVTLARLLAVANSLAPVR